MADFFAVAFAPGVAGNEAGEAPSPRPPEPAVPANWAFLTNHARVLANVAADPTIRIRDLAARVGLTDRGVTRIITDLEEEGYVTAARFGRRNRYTVNRRAPLRPGSEAHRTIAELITFLGIKSPAG